MWGLCAFKNAGGRPGEGIHAPRLFGLAAVDVIGTLLIALIVAHVFRWRVWIVVPAAYLLGIAAHALFCVDTAMMRALRVSWRATEAP
jgi:hypothetical protein